MDSFYVFNSNNADSLVHIYFTFVEEGRERCERVLVRIRLRNKRLDHHFRILALQYRFVRTRTNIYRTSRRH